MNRLGSAFLWCLAWIGLTYAALAVTVIVFVVFAGGPYGLIVAAAEIFFIGRILFVGLAVSAPVLLLLTWLSWGPGRGFTAGLLGAAWAVAAVAIGSTLIGHQGTPFLPHYMIAAGISGAAGAWIAEAVVGRRAAPASAWQTLFPPVLHLIGVAVRAALTTHLWREETSDRYYKLVFELQYDGIPLHLTTAFHCAPDIESLPTGTPQWVDTNRKTASYTLPDGKGLIIQYGRSPCWSSTRDKPAEWRDAMILFMLDDPVHPTEIVVYRRPSLLRGDANAPWLRGVRIENGTESDRDAAMTMEIGALRREWQFSFAEPSDKTAPHFQFVVVEAQSQESTADNPPEDAFFTQFDAKRPAAPSFADEAATAAYFDLASGKFGEGGTVRGRLNPFPPSECIPDAVWKTVSPSAFTQAKHGCEGSLFYFKQRDQTVRFLSTALYTYQPRANPNQFPGFQP